MGRVGGAPQIQGIPKLTDLIDNLNISDVAGQEVVWDTRKSSRTRGDYWALCPFHKETSASFHVLDHSNTYKCFGCGAQGDIVKFLQELRGLSRSEALKELCLFAGYELVDYSLVPVASYERNPSHTEIIDLKGRMEENFGSEHYLELGLIVGLYDQIRSHPRLLRSLHFGDDDYSSHVMDLVVQISRMGSRAFSEATGYVNAKFPRVEENAISESDLPIRSLAGYNFEKPRNDCIAVMMPFSSNFAPVYDAIGSAAQGAGLPVRRADEIWNHAVLVNDILELINHSALVICDLTGRNENVFYEMGISHAWGKTVIPITQSAGDIPFDIRHYRYVKYLNNAEGLERLVGDLRPKILQLVECASASKNT